MHDDAPSEKPDPSLCGATGTRVPIIAPIAPKRVVFVLYDGFQPLDLAGPWQAFSSANEEAEAALYQLGTVAAEPVVATWDQGLRMQVDCTFSEDGDGPVDMIVVPGGPGVERASAHGETRAWLPARRRHAPHLQRLHRRLPAGLRRPARRPRRHHALALGRPAAPAVPALRVEDDRLYVDSGKYWTSAGVSAGIDLALALIERDHGPELSQQVARRLVVFMRRGGDQRQYSQTLRLQDRAGAPFRELVQKMEARLSARWSIDDMADACGMSRRTFQRKFIAHFGVAPTEVLHAAARARRRRAGDRQDVEEGNGKAPGADGLTGPPRLPAGGMAALPAPTDTPPHMDQLPVTKAARRSMNMATTCATSSGKPLRPTGIAASSARVRGSPGIRRVEQFRRHRPRRHGVHRDAVGRQFQRPGPRHGRQRALGRAIGRAPRFAQRGAAADVDHSSVAGRAHARQQRLQQHDGRHEVDGHGARQRVLRDGLDAGDLDHAGVVDQMQHGRDAASSRGSPAARASARSTERKVSPGNRDSGAPRLKLTAS